VHRTLLLPTPLPIDAPRSRSGGGKHSKGKGTRKKANPMPVRKSKGVQRSKCTGVRAIEPQGSSRTGESAVEPRESNNTSTSTEGSLKQGRTGNPDQRREPRSKPYRRRAMSRFQESAVRNRMTPVGQVENMSVQVRRGAGQKANRLIAISMAVEHPTILCSTMQLRRLGPG
jgi:hypothetical protein